MPDARPGLETDPVPEGSLAPSETKIIRGQRASTPEGTQHVPDGTQHVPDGTQHVPDLPRFGRFQTTAELGAGGMGTVYRALDDVLGRPVAIKTLHAAGDAGIRERFLREARAIGAVHHPHILAIYNAGTEGETPYLVMELASGGSLRDRIKAGPLPVDAVRQLGIQIARALAAAHAVNILHRDIKPGNILCTQDGVWKLADFGIARLPDSTLTVTGQFLGSPSYAAPESLRAGEFSPASDLYGLGATLYEALTGVPPYGDHDMKSLIRKLEEDPPPLRERVAVPGTLGDAIMATLARDPAKRPSAEHLAVLLASSDAPEAHVAPAPATAHVAPAPATAHVAPAPVTWSRTRKLVIAGVAAAALLIIILATRTRPQTSAQAVPPQTPGTGTELETTPAGAAAEPDADPDQGGDPDQGEDTTQLPIVDQYGNPVDEETARQVRDQIKRDQIERDQIERDYQDEPRPRGRGRSKRWDRY